MPWLSVLLSSSPHQVSICDLVSYPVSHAFRALQKQGSVPVEKCEGKPRTLGDVEVGAGEPVRRQEARVHIDIVLFAVWFPPAMVSLRFF